MNVCLYCGYSYNETINHSCPNAGTTITYTPPSKEQLEIEFLRKMVQDLTLMLLTMVEKK